MSSSAEMEMLMDDIGGKPGESQDKCRINAGKGTPDELFEEVDYCVHLQVRNRKLGGPGFGVEFDGLIGRIAE